MLHVKRVDKDMKDLALVERLMVEAFPEEERVPFSCLLRTGEPDVDFLAFYDADTFCALAWVYNWRDLSFLFYFAVDEGLRGKGYGSQVLTYLKESRAGRRLVLDIEPVNETAENSEQRKRRKRFYLRNGFTETGISYHWQGNDFDLLIHSGSVTDGEVSDLYRHIHESWR